MTTKTRVAVAKGDGIGPEIMDSVISIFNAAGVPLEYEYVDMGKSIFDKGFSTGMTPEAREAIERLGVLFKGPMETPKGKGVKSINVTARKVWNTYANVRKFRTFKGVDTVFSKAGIPINMTVLRENIEDTYGGVEFMHSYDVSVSYRFITRPGSEQFIRFAFEYAKREGIKQVTCGHKANIMKLTDGLFMNTFYEIAKEYPEIQVNDLIVDDLAMKLVRQPDKFQLILLTNLQGDIISDLCAGLVGGLGFAPSANVGNNVSIFEAVHGTAPDIAGKKMANPTSLLLSGIMMLRHVGLISYADRIENALLYTLENGQHTSDFGEKGSPSLNTDEFAKAIADNLGKKPSETPAVDTGTPDFEFHKPEMPDQLTLMCSMVPVPEKLVGADVFIDSKLYAEQLAPIIQSYLPEKLTLKILSNRGTQVWPAASLFTDSVAHYAARLELKDKSQTISQKEILECCMRLTEKLKIADIEFLKEWGDMRGYSLAQGQ
jgi:isocitrate dehydrogenase